MMENWRSIVSDRAHACHLKKGINLSVEHELFLVEQENRASWLLLSNFRDVRIP